MKKDIHPTYNDKVNVSCACGAAFTTGSTLPEIKIEICSACHPFYTGKQKLIDTAKRVEKFEERMSKKTATKAVGGKKAKRVKRAAQKLAKQPKAEKEQS